MDNKKLYERIILRTGIIILLCYFIKYWAVNIIDALLPIILAIILVMLLAPTIKKIDDLLPIKNTVISYVVGTILLIVILFLLFWLLQFIINQVSGLIGNIIGNWDQIVSSTNQWIQSINSKINLLPTFAANTIRSSLNSLYQFLGNLQKNVINITFGFTTAFINTSNNIIFFVITFIVAFYIMLGDINEVSVKYNTKFSENIKNKLKLVKNIFKNSTWKYIKAQLKLAILCTILMAVCLKFLGQQYFIPIALILGFVDLLPLIGPVIVLLPWSIIELFIFSNINKGVALLIILTFWTGLRQVIAPKIIGTSADIHPILSVISLYAGLRLFGVKGAIFFPILMIFIVGIYRSGILDNWIYDYKLFFNYVQNTLDINKN
jgi:hypothetical protein